MFLSMRAATAVKSVSLHDALKALAFGDAADCYRISFLEHLHAYFVSDRLCRRSRQSPFSKSSKITKFFYMPFHRLVYIFRFARPPAKLYRAVAVFLNHLYLRNDIGRYGNNSNRTRVPPLVPYLRHIHLC